MLSGISIRRVAEDDIEKMVENRISYLTEMQGERGQSYIEKLKQELNSYFRNAVAEGSFLGLLAETDGKVLSYGGMVIRKIPGDFYKPFYLEADILNMYTLPEYRRKGISTLVLKRLISEARNMGISKLALHTTRAGEKMYRDNGFADPVFPFLELIID